MTIFRSLAHRDMGLRLLREQTSVGRTGLHHASRRIDPASMVPRGFGKSCTDWNSPAA
jgi:hypothetical protein